MAELTAEQVTAYMEFAFSGERVHPSIRLAAAIVDANGDVLAAAGEIGAPPLLKDIAECKAKSCVSIGMPTRAIMDLAQIKPFWFQSATLELVMKPMRKPLSKVLVWLQMSKAWM